MSANTFGKIFQLTSFGESHGPAIGGVITGCPSGINLNLEQIQSELDRRKPGQSNIVTQRKEEDTVIFHSGIFENKTYLEVKNIFKSALIKKTIFDIYCNFAKTN